jgi:two-component system phosphate regulon sensor histidine kinase PhoR
MKADKKARILIVDDELPVCKSISHALREEGYDVDMALSGEEALCQLPRRQYEVMVVDLMMPGMSGMEVLAAVRERGVDIPVVIVTGYPSTRTAVQSVKRGACDYLPKPFTPRELQAAVARALEGHRLCKKTNPSD